MELFVAMKAVVPASSEKVLGEKMASGGARVALIERPINDAIEEHRCRSRKNHAKNNQQQNAQRRTSVRGNDKRAESKR